MIRWAFDVIRLTVALAVNSLRLRRAQAIRAHDPRQECMICGVPRPRGARWIHTCDDCIADPARAMEAYRRHKETTKS